MRSTAALLLAAALVAGPAAAGERELIRFRGPDGTPGLVDDADKLPPGAVILDRTPLRPIEDRDDPRADDAERAPEAGLDPPPPARQDDAGRAERCLHYGLSRGCGEDEAAAAADWCSRGLAVHRARESAEKRLERAEEAYEDCRTAGGTVPYCSRRRLDAAEHDIEEAERSLEELEAECRSAECLPGWIREGCERS